MMHDPPRPRDRQLLLTRGHLYALAAMAVALSTVTFFLGVQVGREGAPPAPEQVVHPLVEAEARTGDLEVLLNKVDQRQPGSQPLQFPASLPISSPPPAAAGEGAVVPPGAPAPPQGGVLPLGGYAIELKTVASGAEADAELEKLKADKVDAYWVTNIVDGQPVIQIRVGGFSSEKLANESLVTVANATGSRGAKVVHAP